jgi:hypothetical protein
MGLKKNDCVTPLVYRPTISRRKDMVGPDGESMYPNERSVAHFQSLLDVPNLQYWLDDVPFTLKDLSEIFLLLSAIPEGSGDDSTVGAKVFLAEIHYYFLCKRDKTKRAHLIALFGPSGEILNFSDFFFAVKCLIQGHSSSTVHFAVLSLLAEFTFIPENDFGDRVFQELVVLYVLLVQCWC